jgi:hypothetical protein
MASKFNLDEFLHNYEPKSLESELSSYIRNPKLQDYYVMENLDDIVGTRAYIRYVNIATAFDGTPKESKIKAGGFLIGGGYYYRGKLIQCQKTEHWTHLVLKFDPSLFGDLQLPARIFSVSLSKNYIFYHKNSNMRGLIGRMKIELLDF